MSEKFRIETLPPSHWHDAGFRIFWAEANGECGALVGQFVNHSREMLERSLARVAEESTSQVAFYRVELAVIDFLKDLPADHEINLDLDRGLHIPLHLRDIADDILTLCEKTLETPS